MRTYKVLRFVAQAGPSGEPVEAQLSRMLNQHAGGGWDLVTFQTIHVAVKPNWLLALLGHKAETQFYDVAIFSK